MKLFFVTKKSKTLIICALKLKTVKKLNYLIHPHFLGRVSVPHDDRAVVVGGCEGALVERAPGDAAATKVINIKNG